MPFNILKAKKNLSAVILCGGEGQRLRPLTTIIPKPLIKIKNKTIIEYIINHFLKYKINNIIIVTGYKHRLLNNFISKKYKKKIIVINTGLKTEIAKRVKKISKYLKRNVILCYGDTLVDINLNNLIKFYLKDHNKFIISSYRFKSSFGILEMDKKDNVYTSTKLGPEGWTETLTQLLSLKD